MVRLDRFSLVVALEREFRCELPASCKSKIYEAEELPAASLSELLHPILARDASQGELCARVDAVLAREEWKAGLAVLSPHDALHVWEAFLDAHRAHARSANIAELFDDPRAEATTSCLGRVRVGAAGEAWPFLDDQPARGVLQLRVEELPAPCPALGGIALLAIFVRDGDTLVHPDDEGQLWCVRAYESIDDLVALRDPCEMPWRPIRWHRQDHDMAAHTWCLEKHVPDELFQRFQKSILTAGVELDTAPLDAGIEHFAGTKVGGWPSTVQYGPPWSSFNRDGRDGLPEFEHVLQIGYDHDLDLGWGDCGIQFLGRGRGDPRTWAMHSECG